MSSGVLNTTVEAFQDDAPGARRPGPSFHFEPGRRVAGLEVEPSAQDGSEEDERRGPMRPARLAPTRSRLQRWTLGALFRLGDVAALLAIGVASAAFVAHRDHIAPVFAGILPFLVSVVLLAWSLAATNAYAFKGTESLARHLLRVAAALGLAGGGLAVLVAAFRPSQGLDGLAFWFCLSFAALMVLHGLWWGQVRAWRRGGRLTPNIVVVGATANAQRLIADALETGDAAVLGVFDDRLQDAPSRFRGVPVLGDTDHLIGHRIMPYVDRVVITVSSRAQKRVRELVERLSVLPNEIMLFVDHDGEAARAAALSRIAETPLARMAGEPGDERRALVKRAQDLAIGSLALVLALPVFAIVALAIKLDSPGPVFFRQRRHGFNNEEIVVWKFRSMRTEASDPTATRQVSRDDDRVTRVGRFIRRTSLDELPQIFNVLAGEMSLVGPRPHAVGMKTGETESARLVAEYAHRHRMKPGMTGWAAIKGSRGPVETPEAVRRRVSLDIEYIERQSFWLDLYIMAMTIPCLLGDEEAVR